MEKYCSRCNLKKDSSEFSKSVKEKSGLRSRCKECEISVSREKSPLNTEPLTPLINENWVDLLGYESEYMISDFGRMYMKERIVVRERKGAVYKTTIKGGFRVLKRGKHPLDFYIKVLLSKDGMIKSEKIHRLVAMAFIPNPDNKPHVNHIDGDKLNNHVSNLEWCTHQENITHAIEHGLKPPQKRGAQCTSSKLTEIQVLEIKSIGKSKTLKEVAIIYGVSLSAIQRILKGHTWF